MAARWTQFGATRIRFWGGGGGGGRRRRSTWSFQFLLLFYFVFAMIIDEKSICRVGVSIEARSLTAPPTALDDHSTSWSSVLQVAPGETATLQCASNDDNHRFQFWQLNGNQILGPGNKIDKRKYVYEVLTGTLYIKEVSPRERGLYTCYCKSLVNTTYNAKSVMLVVKSDWRQMWENDQATVTRIGIIILVVAFLMSILLAIYSNAKAGKELQFEDFHRDSVSDEISSRKASYTISTKTCKKFGKSGDTKKGSSTPPPPPKGIDNPALQIEHDSITLKKEKYLPKHTAGGFITRTEK